MKCVSSISCSLTSSQTTNLMKAIESTPLLIFLAYRIISVILSATLRQYINIHRRSAAFHGEFEFSWPTLLSKLVQVVWRSNNKHVSTFSTLFFRMEIGAKFGPRWVFYFLHVIGNSVRFYCGDFLAFPKLPAFIDAPNLELIVRWICAFAEIHQVCLYPHIFYFRIFNFCVAPGINDV